ncbi:hypothetical protein KG091_04400 [Carnobacteriaceae bacterium zg-ZUI78]|nr:hypothetical protein [Carnobacteriaceae bacterium zg-ZUI78]
MYNQLSVNLRQTDGGNVIKQGDTSSVFTYELLDDEEHVMTQLDGQTADILIGQSKTLAYQTTSIVENGAVTFTITKPLPAKSKGYIIEIFCGGYVFPSDKSATIVVNDNMKKYVKDDELHDIDTLTDERIKQLIKESIHEKESQNTVFKQTQASNVWTIEHALNRYPSVVIIDSAGTQVYGDVHYISLNKLEIRFTAAFSGTAVLI